MGKGTPSSYYSPKVLVTKGLYKVIRNPMYVGIILLIFGEGILFESSILFIYTIILWLIFHLWVVYYKESTLKKKFGIEYENYYKAVPRWIPKIKIRR